MSCDKARTIIENIYSSPEILECIDKTAVSNRADFKQELFLILLEYDCDKIVDISDKGGLRWFVVRVILNLSRQTRNAFHKKYLDPRVDYNTDKVMYSLPPSDLNTMEERIVKEKKEEQLIAELNGIDVKMGNDRFPVYETLVGMIVEYGGMRETSRKTGIPVATISTIVKRVRTHLSKI